MKNYNNLTIFFVSYYSKKKIEKIISKLNSKIKFLIIDNANEDSLKKNLEKKYKNVRVIKSPDNKGQTGGINLGFRNIKTKYSIYMDSDIRFNPKIIDVFLKSAKKIKDFIIFAPQHERSAYKSEFHSNKFNKFKDIQLMKLVHGHFLFFNMKNVKKVGLFDENFFLYYEETDFCFRAHKKKQKIYVFPKIKVSHESGKSVEKGNPIEVEANKNWHFMWSKFYYYKKNYSYYEAYKNTIFDLLESFVKFNLFYFFNYRKKTIFYNRISGLINSYMGKKSFRRLKI